MKKPQFLYKFFLLSFALFLLACSSTSSFKGYAYKGDSESSVKEAIKASLANTSSSEGLRMLQEWHTYIGATKTIRAEYKNTLRSELYRYEGDAYTAMSDFSQAQNAYDLAIELDRNNVNARFNRAALFSNNLHEYDIAIKELDNIIKLKPDFADAYFAVGQINDELKSYKAAIHYYNKAIAINPNVEQYRANKEGAYNRFYQTENVREDAEEFVRKYPEDVDAYKLRAAYRHMDEKYEQALEDYTTIIALETDISNKAANYSNRAYMYAALQKYEEAVKDFSKAIELQKSYTGILYASRGETYFKMGNEEKALEDFEMGVKNSGGSPVPYTMRGDYCMAVGRYVDAVEDYTAAIDLYAYSQYYEKRAEAYRKLGNNEKAIEDEKNAKDTR